MSLVVRSLARVLAAVVLLLPALVWRAAPAASAHLGCGAFITTDTVLDSDIGPCSSVGIVIRADNVVLDLNGHTLFGTASPGELMGILLDHRSGVTVRNGTVTGFDGGVTLTGGDNNTVSKLMIKNNNSQRASLGSGIAVISSSDNLIEKNTVVDNGPADGIYLDRGSRRNVVTKNEFAGNVRDGIFGQQASSDNVVEKNDVNQNGRSGHLSAPTLRPSFQNLGPTLFDVVAPDRAPYAQGTNYRVMRFSGSGDVTSVLQAVDLTLPPEGGPNPNDANTSTSGCEAADYTAAGSSPARSRSSSAVRAASRRRSKMPLPPERAR